jgi:hypothetical protein
LSIYLDLVKQKFTIVYHIGRYILYFAWLLR